jgi:hypothetical protein
LSAPRNWAQGRVFRTSPELVQPRDRDPELVQVAEVSGVVDVEGAVPPDVHFRPCQQTEIAQAAVELADHGCLLEQPLLVAAVRYGEIARVISDGDVFEPLLASLRDHGLDRVGAVGPVGLDL